ncbi:MAG: class I SAM-dependent methyltransferase [Bacilli bacterium]
MSTEKFRWSHIQSAQTLEQSRFVRFRPEMRPILLNYFGLTPGMTVLEVGCGPDTMASYLAEGIAPGTVTGIDLDEEFIQRAKTKAKQNAIPNVFFYVGNSYNLPFEDGRFDAVVSYTGVGVLTDPEVATQEMIRVCRPGGTISIAEAATGRLGINFLGIDSVLEEEPFPGANRYHEFVQRIQAAVSDTLILGVGSRRWSPQSVFGLLGKSGVTRIRFNAWGYGTAPDDARVPLEQRQRLREAEYQSQKEWLEELRETCQTGISHEEFGELITLTAARFDWLSNHAAYDWEAGVSIVVSGMKATS